ncbi:MAG TPA: hypothetical protein VGE98_04800 [Thermoanaerobaculia bacterium]
MRCVFFALLLSFPAAALAQPALTFETQAAVAGGLTPSGPVGWFSVAREITEEYGTTVRRDAVVTADAQGGSRFELDHDLPFKSVWVAIDLTSGAMVAATPPGFPLQQVAPATGEVVDSFAGLPDGVQESRAAIEILVARPGVGAWGLSVARGGTGDANAGGSGSTLRASLSSLTAVGTSPPAPTSYAPSDVVVVIDPDTLEIVFSQIPGAHP